MKKKQMGQNEISKKRKNVNIKKKITKKLLFIKNEEIFCKNYPKKKS